MRQGKTVSVIIPALNEEYAIGKVIAEIPAWADLIVVADNGSTDGTARAAKAAGAEVVSQPKGGYGAACLAGIAHVHQKADIIVFVDGDYSDYPADMHRLTDPIAHDQADMVIGSRLRGNVEAGALTPQQRFGNMLACFLIRLFWGVRFTDLGPFRAVSATALERLDMKDQAFGWTVEMQVRSAQLGLRALEVPVDYRRRIGVSKISGTIKGTFLAGKAILGVIIRSALRRSSPRQSSVKTHPPAL